MDDTSYSVPEATGPRVVAQQQRAGTKMDGAVGVRENPQLGLTIPAPIGGGGLGFDRQRLWAVCAHVPQRRPARWRAP